MANQEKAAPPPKLRAAAEAAVKSIGSGFDMVMDCRLEYCKDPYGSRLIDIYDDRVGDLALPGGVALPNVPDCIRCGKGDRMLFSSGVLTFQQIYREVWYPYYYWCQSGGKGCSLCEATSIIASSGCRCAENLERCCREELDRIEYGLTFMDSSTLSIYSHREEITFMWRRRGGSNNKTMSHEKWCQSVKLEPEVISMTFIPISSFLSGINGKGFLSHAINLYQRYKPPIESLHQFLDFQTVKLWAPVHGELTLVHGREQQSNPCFQFSFLGPRLYVNTDLVDVGRKPVIGARLYLEGRISNSLAIHLQHLSDCPKTLQLLSESSNKSSTSLDQRYCEKVRWKIFDHVCTAPIESDHDLDIVTGAQFQVKKSGLQDVLFLLLKFSRVSSDVVLRKQEWDCFPDLAEKSGLVTSFLSSFVGLRQPPKDPDVNLNSAVYPDGPPVSAAVHELLRFVDTRETKRGPQDAPGFWVVSGARLLIEKGKISLSIKYSLFLHRFAC